MISLKGSIVDGTVHLMWDRIPDAARYEVWCSDRRWKPFSMICYEQSQQFIHYTAKPGHTTRYFIRALDAYCRELDRSNRISLRAGYATPRVSGSISRKGRPLLHWTPVTGAVKYQVFRMDENGQTTQLLGTTALPAFEDAQCVPGASRCYSVTAVGALGRRSNASDSILLTGLYPAPYFRTCISKKGFPMLTWKLPEEHCICHIFRTESKSEPPVEIAFRIGVDSYINTAASLGQTYFYTIRMEYADGIWSAPSKLREIRRPDYTDEILEPELTKTKRGKLRLTWNPIEDAAKYQILTSAKYSADKYEVQFETEKTSYLNSAYSFDEIKYYRIRAVHNDGMLGKMSRIIKVDPEQFQD